MRGFSPRPSLSSVRRRHTRRGKPNNCGATSKEGSSTKLPSADIPPSLQDTTVRSSALPSPTIPQVETLPDDDPSPCDARDDLPIVETVTDDDDDDPDFQDQGRDDFAHSINSVHISEPVFTPSADVFNDDTVLLQNVNTEPHAPCFDDDPDALRAQIDSGAFASCTDQLHMLHDYREFSDSYPCPVKLLPASEGSDLVPLGVGYLHIPAYNERGHLEVRTFYHPSLRTTVIDERDFVKSSGLKPKDFSGSRIEKFDDAGTFTFTASHRLRRCQDVVVHGVLVNGKCYTAPLIPPDLPTDHPEATPANSCAKALADDPEFAAACERATIQNIYTWQEEEYAELRDNLRTVPRMYHDLPFHEYIQKNTPVDTIRTDTERLLWHQRLGHPSDYYLFNAHQHVNGVPRFSHAHRVLDNCPTCIRSKQTKEPAGKNTTRTASVPYQGLSIDFSFAGMKSKDEDRAREYTGLHGETSWILVTDHFSRRLHGDTRVSKATPLKWLRHFLQHHSPRSPGKYVYLDQGGELYNNPAVRKLFEEFNYDVRPTGADASNQNGPVERAHLTVANGVRSLLHGADLDPRFWPYAFHHYLRITNALPSRDQDKSPLTIATGKVDDFSQFRTFGCRVWVRPPGRRPAKFRNNSRKGIFLGFLPNTTKNIIWFDPETSRVKLAKHARFDEGMNDLPFDRIPPNVQHLIRSKHGEKVPPEPRASTVDEFHFTTNPFSHTLSRTLKVSQRDSTFGLELASDELFNRAFVSDVKKKSSAANLFSSHKATRNKIRGAYIVSIDGERVFTIDDAKRILRRLHDEHVDEFEIVFAPEKRLDASQLRKALIEHNIYKPNEPDDEEHVPSITLADLRSIASILHPETDFHDPAVTHEEISVAINALSSHSLTPEEQALGHFTRRKLKTLSTWPEWRAGEHLQLDRMHRLGMYGAPVKRPPGAIVLRLHWQYKVKSDGTRRSRNCCDGSPRAAPVLHGIASTYSSCVEQPIQRLFLALAAHMGYPVFGGDAEDAYAHSPPPETPTFVAIDDAYADWYEHKYGTRLDRSLVIPVLHALQGHPESGRLWEEHINPILADIGFRHTTHDRTIYSAVFDDSPVLLLRQVDDFSLACPNEALAKRIYGMIGERLQLPSETEPPFKYLGLIHEYNGVNIIQSRDSIAVNCRSYISRVLTAHGWAIPDRKDPSGTKLSPLPSTCINQLYQDAGPAEGTSEHSDLAAKHGFSYRTLLGELLYAYVTCRPDIGYAVTTLSKFSIAPSDIHYAMLKGVAKYLRRTIDWGIIYRKSSIDPNLPASADIPIAPPDDLPEFPSAESPLQLLGYVDAAHANDLRTRRSTTGYAFLLCGGAVSYRTKTQSITATSSTEAEFLAAVLAAKHAKYLRAIMSELGFAQTGPTPLYIDNISALKMINAKVPTQRSRHIDIQHFAIQDWKDAGDIVMHHVPGIINPSDDLTKPLGWVLHERHARRIMGHYR